MTTATNIKRADIAHTYDGFITDKINELRQRNKELKSADCTLTKNTISSQLYKNGRELRVLKLIKALLDDALTQENIDTLVSITTLVEERKVSVVQVKEGDSILEVLQKYSDVKNLSEKLEKTCNKEGLKLDYTAGKIVKA